MKSFVDAWKDRFSFDKYSLEFYYSCLEEIQKTNDPNRLGELVIGMLHWKDGKVREDEQGDFCVSGYTYRLLNPKLIHIILKSIMTSCVHRSFSIGQSLS
ncbi:hypothetical protein [Litchfieldia salsa]|uniref:Uncharacterized protein n=1 Tax=Litchfieldia salsa TaxID=930152 RepID=A0A1H0PMZ4_9BACI|nr:hypothetical protein [Litchfieldia salsa]SDP05989.1 hypothetical protein SAMN05216565_101375 [Litchfieldia salsa]